jgi:hypothetical protein
VGRFELAKEVSFIEYLKSGLELNFTVAVDFTGSNGLRSPSHGSHRIMPKHMKFN